MTYIYVQYVHQMKAENIKNSILIQNLQFVTLFLEKLKFSKFLTQFQHEIILETQNFQKNSHDHQNYTIQ